jgi:hypothetical protein
MTGKNIGMLIGDPIVGDPIVAPYDNKPSSVFPTYHASRGGVVWTRNDNNRLVANTSSTTQPTESIFAASNSSALLLPYMLVFATGGTGASLHYEEYTFEQTRSCAGDGPRCIVDLQAPLSLKRGESAGGFSIAGNWSLSAESMNTRVLKSRKPEPAHTLIVVGGDYKQPDDQSGTASFCIPSEKQTIVQFTCTGAATPPHGYRSAVAYDPATKTWITVGPNGTDISIDDGRNWRPLRPGPGDPPDADQHWNALSLPFVVGPHGRIGKLEVQALPH